MHYLLRHGPEEYALALDRDGLRPADVVGRMCRPFGFRTARKVRLLETIHAMLEARAFVDDVAEDHLIALLPTQEAAAMAQAKSVRRRRQGLVSYDCEGKTVDEEEVARGKSATADTNLVDDEGRSHGASLALDGDSSTFWSTKENCNRATWQVDLEASVRIHRIMIAFRPPKGDVVFFARRFTVDASLDGKAWDTVHRTRQDEAAAADRIKFANNQAELHELKLDCIKQSNFSARHVRFSFTLAGMSSNPTIAVTSVQLFCKTAHTEEVAKLERMVASNPESHAARFALAQQLFVHEQYGAAVQAVLELLRRATVQAKRAGTRVRNGLSGSEHVDTARALLEQIFYSLGEGDDVVVDARRELTKIQLCP